MDSNYMNWNEENLYLMECRFNYLSNQPLLSVYDTYELEDLKTKIAYKKQQQDAIEKNRKEIYERLKLKEQEEEKEKQMKLQNEKELFKNNANVPPTMYEDLKDYLDSHLDTEVLLKINITMNIKKLQDLIEDDKINYCNDTDLNNLIDKCLAINKKKYIYRKNAVKMIIDYINEVIEKLKIINKDLYEKSKEKEKSGKNNWAKQKFNCEYCGKEMIKAHKSRHYNVCKSKPN
jgi:hypothetical protein